MKQIKRSQTDRIISGVCGGFADYLGIDPTIVRLVWIFFTVFSGVGILAYILSIILIPEGRKIDTKEIAVNDKDDKMVLWGVVLVIVGIVLFFRHKPIVGAIWHSFWGAGFSAIFAIAIIALGIYVLYNRNNKNALKIGDGEIGPLHLSTTDKKIAGVCGGIAESIGIDSTLVRLLWVFGTFISAGIGIVLYIICVLVLNQHSETIEEVE